MSPTELTAKAPEIANTGKDTAPDADPTARNLAKDKNTKGVEDQYSDYGPLGREEEDNPQNHGPARMPGLEQKAHLLSVPMDQESGTVDEVDDLGKGIGSSKLGAEEASKELVYFDPTPKTPRQEVSPSRGGLVVAENHESGNSTSEIQNIMEQFDDGDGDSKDGLNGAELFQSHSHLQMPMEHPPRRSSLEPLGPASSDQNLEAGGDTKQSGSILDSVPSQNSVPPLEGAAKASSMRTSSLTQSASLDTSESNIPASPHSSKSMPKLQPPQPDPEPDLPFDFHRFLEQLRHRTADPVAKFLRSFLIEFGKKQWMVHEQVKIINDFLTFITNKMAHCEVWRGVSDAEFDNVKEGMEKLVMNRLYSQTFSPAIPPPAPSQGPKGKKKNTEKTLASGRKGQHQEDIERDEILGQKVRIYGWVQEEHLDIPPVGDSGRRFLVLAQQGNGSLRHESHVKSLPSNRTV